MKLVKSLQRRRLTTIALVVACCMAGGVAVWQASKLRAQASAVAPGQKASKLQPQASSEDKQRLQNRLRRGVGSEVRFASAVAKPAEIEAAVESTAEFIYRRSGLRMSDETKKKLVRAESDVLKGKARHITLEELTDNFTAAVAERLPTLTDEEIWQATEVSSDALGQISSRADGKWGVLTKKELTQQARSGREWGQRGDFALRSTLRSMIVDELNDRVSTLVTALPEQFGQADTQGVTPAQALLLAYSVAADDPLTDSQSDIEQLTLQLRMDSGQTREQKRAQKKVTGRPYGPRGLFHPSAPHLFINEAGVGRLLTLTEGGEK